MSAGDIDVILYRLDAMARDITEIKAEQKAVASRGVCPAPGSCVVIQRDLEKFTASSTEAAALIDSRVRDLENLRAEGRGVAMAAKAFWAFVGAGGLGIAFSAYSILKKV
jgi:hypothetical protein